MEFALAAVNPVAFDQLFDLRCDRFLFERLSAFLVELTIARHLLFAAFLCVGFHRGCLVAG